MKDENSVPSTCPIGETPTVFTANHGQPKPLLNGGVLRTSCSSQAHNKHRRLRPASLRDGLRTGPDSGESPGERVSRHVDSEGIARGRCPGRSAQAVLHLDTCPWSATRQARRRDGIPALRPSRPAVVQHPARAITTGQPQSTARRGNPT